MSVFAFTAGSLGDILATAGLAVRIVNVLYDGGYSPDEYRALMCELQSLHRAVILTKDAVEHHRSTPLGQSLANTIGPEVAQCHAVMRMFLGKIDGYRQPLVNSGIGGLWRKVWWAAWEMEELASLRRTLSTHRSTLTMLLTALNSCVSVFSLDFLVA
jgi:hypothetical protein